MRNERMEEEEGYIGWLRVLITVPVIQIAEKKSVSCWWKSLLKTMMKFLLFVEVGLKKKPNQRQIQY